MDDLTRPTPRAHPAAYAFLASAILLSALVAGTLFYAGGTPERRGDAGRTVLENDARVLFVQNVRVPPGWGVNVPGWLVSNFHVWHAVTADFLVVDQGGAQELLAGEDPSRVYLSEPAVAQTMYGMNRVVWPQSERVELVWLADGVRADARAREAMRHEVDNWLHPVHVVDPDAAPLLPGLFAAIGIGTGLTVVTGLVWFRAARRAPVPAEAGQTEALVLLVEQGHGHLRDLRSVLRLAAGLLAFAGCTGFIALFTGIWSASGSIDFTALPSFAPLLLLGGALVAYLSAWLVWSRYYLNVRRELARWTARSKAPAFG